MIIAAISMDIRSAEKAAEAALALEVGSVQALRLPR
jgi:hypothetical protein